MSMPKCIKAMQDATKAVFQPTMVVFLHIQTLRLGNHALFCHTKAVFLQIQCALDLFVQEIGRL